MNNFIKLKVAPEWENLDAVRVQTDEFLKTKNFDSDTRDSIRMNISELMENAVKYGRFNDNMREIEASVMVTRDDIIVEVRSPVKNEDDENLRKLDRVVQWIRGFQNPFEAYIEKLKEVATQPSCDSESGLGIVRIAYEGQSIIDFYINELSIISVSAVYHLPAHGRR